MFVYNNKQKLADSWYKDWTADKKYKCIQEDTKETNLCENDGGKKNWGGKCLDLKALVTFSLCY